MQTNKNIKRHEQGFALLISLIVVGVVLSVGMTILDLSIKQVRLSTSSRDSETAFHASNAGAECARYWRREKSDTPDQENTDAMVLGEDVDVSCFGSDEIDISPESGQNEPKITVGTGKSYLYKYEFTWGAGNDRCTKINTIVTTADIDSPGPVLIANIKTLIPSYPEDTTECEPGSQCTILSSRGYNKPCPAGEGAFGYGTVEREVLLQF